MADADRVTADLSRFQDGAAGKRIEMIKTFSISALFFMTLGVACASHIGLPF